ncbi:SIMPL domain-containing protein [Aestuariimicrobium ganziense]|uniref:SIMPL domain-containing protein n=1 Tax=Aestuariimicrobium ganziense TaxID=2773677 RepID=UPI0019430641|nr:SIMPL domain-containing protein [Aestuariimicrobium ganziense]
MTSETERWIEVQGVGTAVAVPDCVEAALTLRHTGPEVAAVLQASLKGMADLGAVLREQGVEGTDIQTSGAQINPQWDPEGHGRVIGHEAHQRVMVRIRDPKAVGQVLTRAAEACRNALGMDGAHLKVSDPSTLAEQARDAAYTDAEAKATALATRAGATLGDCLRIVEGSSHGDQVIMRSMAAEKAFGGVEAGQSTIEVVLTVRFALS